LRPSQEDFRWEFEPDLTDELTDQQLQEVREQHTTMTASHVLLPEGSTSSMIAGYERRGTSLALPRPDVQQWIRVEMDLSNRCAEYLWSLPINCDTGTELRDAYLPMNHAYPCCEQDSTIHDVIFLDALMEVISSRGWQPGFLPSVLREVFIPVYIEGLATEQEWRQLKRLLTKVSGISDYLKRTGTRIENSEAPTKTLLRRVSSCWAGIHEGDMTGAEFANSVGEWSALQSDIFLAIMPVREFLLRKGYRRMGTRQTAAITPRWPRAITDVWAQVAVHADGTFSWTGRQEERPHVPHPPRFHDRWTVWVSDLLPNTKKVIIAGYKYKMRPLVRQRFTSYDPKLNWCASAKENSATTCKDTSSNTETETKRTTSCS
jgi:hypothetical protein